MSARLRRRVRKRGHAVLDVMAAAVFALVAVCTICNIALLARARMTGRQGRLDVGLAVWCVAVTLAGLSLLYLGVLQ